MSTTLSPSDRFEDHETQIENLACAARAVADQVEFLDELRLQMIGWPRNDNARSGLFDSARRELIKRKARLDELIKEAGYRPYTIDE